MIPFKVFEACSSVGCENPKCCAVGNVIVLPLLGPGSFSADSKPVLGCLGVREQGVGFRGGR